MRYKMIDKVYEQLRNDCVCDSAYQFSSEYLGKSPSYYSVYKMRKQQPTVDMLLILEFALSNAAERYSSTRYPFFIRTRNQLLKLQDDVKKYRKSTVINKINNYKATIN